MTPGETRTVQAPSVVIKVESGTSTLRAAGRRLLVSLLVASIFLNFMFLVSSAMSVDTETQRVQQKHHSGSRLASDKLAIVSFSGTIMPPYTEQWLEQIEAAAEDDDIKGVLLAVDSPGGLVADSHQLYHEIKKLSEKKPVYVAMKRLAASGGYYLSMGIGEGGQIFVEPTTWTGSIGVIIPRYNASELAEKVGVEVDPLTTGPLKDSLNPFRDLSEREREVWAAIMKDSFDRFVNVIAENRANLSEDDVRELATGQIYTADQSLQNGLADQMGFEEEALTALASAAGVTDYEVVEYSSPVTFLDLLVGSASAKQQPTLADSLMDAAIPKAMYYCSWNPWVPGTSGHR